MSDTEKPTCYGCWFGNMCSVRQGLEGTFRNGSFRADMVKGIYGAVADSCEKFTAFPEDDVIDAEYDEDDGSGEDPMTFGKEPRPYLNVMLPPVDDEPEEGAEE